MHLDSMELVPFDDFESASRAVLSYLHNKLGFGLWMMTRTHGEEWVVLQAEDHGYNVQEGAIYNWADSFCSQMVQGFGPRIAPCSNDIPVYAHAPIGQQVPIGAYIGVPVNNADGSLFGTLCAIDPKSQPPSIAENLPLIELFSRFLATILESELAAIDKERQLEKVKKEALTDELTDVLNRRGWDRTVELEEERARRYGTPMSVFIIDLDDLKTINDSFGHAKGDEKIRRAAKSIQNSIRLNDVVARIGGDEFAVLAIECEPSEATLLKDKIQKTLCDNGIEASIGWSRRGSEMTLSQAIEQADLAMYQEKTEHKAHCKARVIDDGV
ncbi:MAG: sensor domain-containing diguanylate cyclase [Thiotrichales bacterium]|nr:sensor domain-containing diguanylate cyclase [Thiotrichales bacterium]